MKCHIVLVLSALGIFTLSSGSAHTQAVTGGLKAGLNIASLRGRFVRDEGWGSKMGFCAGGFITISITERFAFQPEVLFTQKGAKYEKEAWGETSRMMMSLDYVEVPLLIKLSLLSPGIIKPNLFIGPFVGLKIDAKYETGSGGRSQELDIGNVIQNTDFGLVLGGGVDFGLIAPEITVDARYALSLTTIYNTGLDSIHEAGYKEDAKNGVISVMLGYSF